jgi:ribose transport system permease protein
VIGEQSKVVPKKIDWSLALDKYGIILIFLAICIILSFLSPVFLTMRNVLNVFRQVSITGIMGVGMTFVILTGGIDLSVGSLLALAGVLAAGLQVNHGAGPFLMTVVPILVVTCLGLLVGFIITKFRIPPFVATLGMMSAARGLALIYTDGYPISGLSQSFRVLGSGMIGPVPVPVVIYLVVVVIGAVILAQTKFGRYVYAIGGNEEAVRLSGIPTHLYKIIIYGISAFTAALSGVILAARLSSGQPTAGEGYELDVIAAVVIGGTSLMGGRGGIFGTFIGALLIGVLTNGFNLLNISPFYQQFVKGIIIVAAVITEQLRSRESD